MAGYVRISVRIEDVQEAFFRVAVDANLSRSITGGISGGDFAEWGLCNTAGSFKHDNLLHVVRKRASTESSVVQRHTDGRGYACMLCGQKCVKTADHRN